MVQHTGPYEAVQEDPTAFCMDWPVFEAGRTPGNGDQGRVFVFDRNGVRVGDARLGAQRNRAADEALNQLGWVRDNAWHRDDFGRQAASVVRVELPARPTLPVQLGSLTDEASLHFA